jgi:hypothetical protein
MAPFRQIAKRHPRLLMLAALLVLTFQSLAVTLDWCLHDGAEVAHLESGVAPCPAEVPDCHGESDGTSLMFSALQSSMVAVPFVAPIDWSGIPLHYVRRGESFDSAPEQGAAASRFFDPPDTGPPRISNAVLGASARLLI